METRKILLMSGMLGLAPTSADVAIIVTPMAIEVTTVVTFDNIPFAALWNLSFPVNIANGRLVQCAVLENAPATAPPSVAFNKQTQTIAMGPCMPQFRTLVFTIVTVYVPSFRNSFIAHLHMGSAFHACTTTIRVRNMLSGPIRVQLREHCGTVKENLRSEEADSDWMSATVLLFSPANYKIHIFLTEPLSFGIDTASYVSDGTDHYVFTHKPKYLPDPHHWILKPLTRDISFMSFYASRVPFLPTHIVPAEPQELLTIAAKIICNRDCFFDFVHCVTMQSDQDSLASLCSKLASLKNMPSMTEWSWRDDVKISPLIEGIISFLDLD